MLGQEKERGTLEQLLVFPLSPFRIIVAKALTMTALGGVLFAFGMWRFRRQFE